jgi:anti-sigma factor RsiW
VAYADGELDPQRMAEIESLLAGSPAAAEKVDMFRDTSVLLRAACAEGFYAARGAGVMSPAPPRRRLEPRWSWAVAACLLGVIMGGGGTHLWERQATSPRAELVKELASYHPVYSRETKHLVEVPAAESDHLKAWLGQRLQRNLAIPDLSAAGLHFAGGRMVVAEGRPVAQLIYTREGGLPVALCIARSEGEPSPISVARRDALRVASWGDAAYAYVVVGELDDARAHALALAAAAQLKS